MKKLWLNKTSDGKFPIAHIACPHPAGNIDLARPAAGVMHTTEGGWDSGLSVFRVHYSPTFLVGAKRIAQLVPLGQMTAALENAAGGVETNRWARVQIEVVGHSKQTPYSFDAGTTDALASLLATLKVECGIPLTRPYPDVMPPGPWAVKSFKRRHDGKWGKTAGWFGHVEIPENEHWDPGALDWSALLTVAKTRLPKATARKPYSIDIENKDGSRIAFEGTKAQVKKRATQFIEDGKFRELVLRRGPRETM